MFMVKILRSVVWLALVLALALNVLSTSRALAQAANSADPHQLPRQFLKKAVPRTFHHAGLAKNGGTTKNGPTTFASTASVPGIDSVANWTGQFTAAGFDGNNNPQSVWPYAMVGTPPESGVTTTIAAPIVPVTVRLLDKNGHVARTPNGSRLILRAGSTLAQAVVNSPIFQPFVYTSGTGQYNDQMQRAEFWNRIGHEEGEGQQLAHSVEPEHKNEPDDGHPVRLLVLRAERRWELLCGLPARRKYLWQSIIPADVSGRQHDGDRVGGIGG
jgi:hypothetical protein